MPDLRCPLCGTPVPDTGMRSWTGMGPPDSSIPEVPRGAWRQHGKCPSCGHKMVRNPEAETPSLAEWRMERPLLQIGGTAIMRGTDAPSGGGSVVYNDAGSGTITLSGSGTEGHSVLPVRVDVSRRLGTSPARVSVPESASA